MATTQEFQIWNIVNEAINDILPIFDQLGSATPKFDSKKNKESLHAIIERMNRPFKLGVIGEFKAGKSSLINAIIDEDVAIIDELAATASLNLYFYSNQHTATIHYKDGHSEEYCISEVNQMLSERREDVKWLETISDISFGVPCDSLRRLQIWDSPGLGAFQFHNELTLEFIEDVDAVIWVFDAGFLGEKILAPVLDKIRNRGKHIIAVVNKTEDWSNEELISIPDVIHHSYPNIPITSILPFSSWMVREFRSGVPESNYLGDLPGDGGLKQLQDTLEREILQNPNLLTSRAAAGDVCAVVYTSIDISHREMLETRRILNLMDDQVTNAERLVKSEMKVLASDLKNDMVPKMRSHFREELKNKLANDNIYTICNSVYMNKNLEEVISKDKLEKFCKDYIENQTDRMINSAQKLYAQQETSLYRVLTPMEQSRYLKNLPIQTPANISFNIPTAINPVPLALPALLGGVFIAIITHAWIPIVLGSLISNATIWITSVINRNRKPLNMISKDYYINIALAALDGHIINVLRPTINTMLEDITSRYGDEVEKVIVASLEERILCNKNRVEWEDVYKMFQYFSQTLKETIKPISACIGININQRSPSLCSPCTIGTEERGKAVELFRAMLDEAQSEICITDGELQSSALTHFIDAPDNLTIRILTWGQPLSNAMSQIFSEKMEELMQRHTGGITVVAPKKYGHVQAEPLPTGCWIFTGSGAYHFDCTLGETLDGVREVHFEPQDNSMRLQHFTRWWNDEVPGYQAIQPL